MQRFETIAVGVDFSWASEQALTHAAELCKAHKKASLQIITVVSQPRHSFFAVDDDKISELISLTQKKLDEFLAEKFPKLDVEYKTHVSYGIPANEMIDYAEKVGSKLLVLGDHSLKARGKGAGEVATKCLRLHKIPIMLVRENYQNGFSKIVVCIDFSKQSYSVMRNAISLASIYNSEIKVLNIFEEPGITWHDHFKQGRFPQDKQEITQRKIERELDDFVQEFKENIKDLKVSIEVLCNNNVGNGVTKFSEEWGADCVVLGSHGHSPLVFMTLGSTAERVVRDSYCSVLVLPPDISV